MRTQHRPPKPINARRKTRAEAIADRLLVALVGLIALMLIFWIGYQSIASHF